MANRWFQQYVFGLEKYPVRLQFKLQATGTQTGNSPQTIVRAKGLTSVTAAATGLWTLTLDDAYNALLGYDVGFQSKDGATAPLNVDAFVLSETVASTKTIVVQLLGGTNGSTATAPAANDIVFIELVLSNSSAV